MNLNFNQVREGVSFGLPGLWGGNWIMWPRGRKRNRIAIGNLDMYLGVVVKHRLSVL
jgi:hypothetical protein